MRAFGRFGALMAMLVVFSFVLSTVARAREGPTKQTIAVEQVMVDAPIVASIPPMTIGYDVICNLATNQIPSRAQPARVSTAERQIKYTGIRLQPGYVLLA
jgi:hypothetical protein